MASGLIRDMLSPIIGSQSKCSILDVWQSNKSLSLDVTWHEKMYIRKESSIHLASRLYDVDLSQTQIVRIFKNILLEFRFSAL